MSTRNTANQVYREFLHFMNTRGIPRSEWYVGVTEHAERTLCTDHARYTQQEYASWIWSECESPEAAREVMAALLALGCSGGSGLGEADARQCYVYLMVLNPGFGYGYRIVDQDR